MQEHEYESVASDPESIFVAQDRWSVGEKLQARPTRMSRLSSYAAVILPAIMVLCVLLVVFFLLSSVAFVHVSHHFAGPMFPRGRGMFPGGGPRPIQQP